MIKNTMTSAEGMEGVESRLEGAEGELERAETNGFISRHEKSSSPPTKRSKVVRKSEIHASLPSNVCQFDVMHVCTSSYEAIDCHFFKKFLKVYGIKVFVRVSV